MPKMRGDRAISCDDCYFRQELLCALKTHTPCPTFRATVGRAPKPPEQAQLIPLPQVEMPLVALLTPTPAVVQEPAAAAAAAAVPGVPFGVASAEANFSINDAGDRESATAQQIPVYHREGDLRVAAAASETGATCVIALEEPAVQTLVDIPVAPVRGAAHVPDSGRSGRISRRIAERYPQALQLC